MSFSCETKPAGSNSDRSNGGSPGGVSGKPPPVFHPPYPVMRNGSQQENESFHQGNRSQRGFRTSSNGHPSPSVNGNEMKGDFGTTYFKKSRSQEQIASRATNFTGQTKPMKTDIYYHGNEGRGSFETYDPVERREGSTRAEERRSDNDNHYAITRDGPSPGRQYHYAYTGGNLSEGMYPSRRSDLATHHPDANAMFRKNPGVSSGKRKALDPTTPEGPRLISNQSSDDSINTRLPPKRPRPSNGLSQDVALMKSFTPLSPIHSRTFSREDPLGMSGFIDPRGSAEGLRIFQSWSSGNTPPQDEHSSVDVRYCYNDWQASHRTWDEKLPPIKEREYENQTGQGPRSQYSAHPAMRSECFPPTHQRNHPPNGVSNHREHLPPSRGYNRTPSSQYCQPLHPEDRCSPYNDRLSKRVPSYGRESEPGRQYWQHDHPSAYQTFPSSRRGEPDVRTTAQSRRGSSHTPTVVNGWGRYGDEYGSPPGYNRQMHPGPPPPHYDDWGRSYVDPVYGPMHPDTHESPSREYVGRHLQSARVESGPDGAATAMRTSNGVLLLALPEDKISLSETLCIVRENIEVFIATDDDVKAPAPGRKRPVVVGQVGLRCIHCRSATHQSEKVKRAVCFPSSIKRIYRTVIDMKLDHFKACRFVPIEFKMKLEQLKATNARSTGTTMQYFVQAATRMGMVDGGHGIRFCKPCNDSGETVQNSKNRQVVTTRLENPQRSLTETPPKTNDVARQRTLTSVPSGVSFSLSMDLSLSGASAGSSNKTNSSSASQASSLKDNAQYFHGKTILALPEDTSALSPLRCFLRENVYAFAATNEDIAVRTPTTFSVVVGQVGIGCIHCHNLPAKDRSNRAVCFPFSIGRIYQSVADIQRFHMSECKHVPPDIKDRFLTLQRASTKGSKGLATRQYWISSAKKLGLADTSNGIRFIRDPNVPVEKAVSLDILAQVATDVTTASRPLVLDEDKPHIARFIYLVMKQLQPCRFTEADRNKRRLKDVGCIGVECKHCAGQVDGRKFFWSSVNAVESNFVSVHTHMMECKQISQELKDELAHLKTLRKEHTAKLKTGSQKAFFSRVWKRLHMEGNKVPSVSAQQPSKSPHVPPQVSVPSDKTKSPPDVSFRDTRRSDVSNISSPDNSFNGSFKEEEASSPIQDQGGQASVVHGLTPVSSPPDSGGKFPLLPLALGSPSSSPPEATYMPSTSTGTVKCEGGSSQTEKRENPTTNVASL